MQHLRLKALEMRPYTWSLVSGALPLPFMLHGVEIKIKNLVFSFKVVLHLASALIILSLVP